MRPSHSCLPAATNHWASEGAGSAEEKGEADSSRRCRPATTIVWTLGTFLNLIMVMILTQEAPYNLALQVIGTNGVSFSLLALRRRALHLSLTRALASSVSLR